MGTEVHRPPRRIVVNRQIPPWNPFPAAPARKGKAVFSASGDEHHPPAFSAHKRLRPERADCAGISPGVRQETGRQTAMIWIGAAPPMTWIPACFADTRG
jgi:hypothetical protein